MIGPLTDRLQLVVGRCSGVANQRHIANDQATGVNVGSGQAFRADLCQEPPALESLKARLPRALLCNFKLIGDQPQHPAPVPGHLGRCPPTLNSATHSLLAKYGC
jgi:hypothetical protein